MRWPKRVTERFGVCSPIVQAPMAGVAGGRLAAAVSAAGGLGMVGGGYAGELGQDEHWRDELVLAGAARVGVGFIGWALDRHPAALDVALAAHPAALFLSFGGLDLAPRIAAAGVPLIVQIQDRAQLDAALDAGAAAVVAQGTEAGGHGGSRATMTLVPEIADALAARSPDTPLLAAGGIADGRGIAAALALGADGVVIGTRFWAAAEALTPKAMTDRAIAATGDDTVRTTAVDALRGMDWPRPFSFRMLKNRLTDAWADREAEAEAARGTLMMDYARARAAGDLDTIATVAGEAIGLIRDRPPAAEIVARLISEAEAATAQLA